MESDFDQGEKRFQIQFGEYEFKVIREKLSIGQECIDGILTRRHGKESMFRRKEALDCRCAALLVPAKHANKDFWETTENGQPDSREIWTFF